MRLKSFHDHVQICVPYASDILRHNENHVSMISTSQKALIGNTNT